MPKRKHAKAKPKKVAKKVKRVATPEDEIVPPCEPTPKPLPDLPADIKALLEAGRRKHPSVDRPNGIFPNEIYIMILNECDPITALCFSLSFKVTWNAWHDEYESRKPFPIRSLVEGHHETLETMLVRWGGMHAGLDKEEVGRVTYCPYTDKFFYADQKEEHNYNLILEFKDWEARLWRSQEEWRERRDERLDAKRERRKERRDEHEYLMQLRRSQRAEAGVDSDDEDDEDDEDDDDDDSFVDALSSDSEPEPCPGPPRVYTSDDESE